MNSHNLQLTTRRHFLRNCPLSLGSLYLLTQGAQANGKPSAANSASAGLHFPATAKNVIYIHCAGSPPTLDMFDYKPKLVELDDQECPEEFLEGRRFAFTTGTPRLLGTPRKFKQVGDCGMWMSDAVEPMHPIADDLCVVRSMHTDQFNHAPAQLLLLTGSPRQGRPSMGSWVTYGLGAENQNLPGFVVLISGGTQPSAGKNAWGSGFLPSVFQGVQCRSKGDPILYVNDPEGMPRHLRRATIDALSALNREAVDGVYAPETETRIAQFELAYRMQIAVPEVMDISRESEATLAAYGAEPGEASFANNCVLARRLVEQGVRFVQLFDWGWDFHGTRKETGLTDGLTTKAGGMSKSFTALIQDLKERGLYDETLIVLGGEFGRTPFREGRTAKSDVLGRDHYPDCYSIVLAGGGVKSGIAYGATDELGFSVAENGVHVHDFQATLLHLLGIDHERLTYRFEGRDYRLTDVHGHVVDGILS